MSLQWERLVSQGRAKDTGIAWTEKELSALYDIAKKADISVVESARYVREGALSFEDFQKSKTPKTREDVEKEAKAAGVDFAPEAPTTVLEKEIIRKTKKVKKTK